jgi:hypothetical protein
METCEVYTHFSDNFIRNSLVHYVSEFEKRVKRSL